MTKPRDISSWLPGLVGPVEIKTGATRYAVRRPVWKLNGVTITDVPDHMDDEGNVVGRTDFNFDTANVEVLDDIAKSDTEGSTVDRCRGFRGIPFYRAEGDTADGAPSEIGAVPVYRTGHYLAKKPVRPGEYDVTNYGVVGDGVTDNWSALQTLINSIPVDGSVGTLYFPPGEYYLSKEIRLSHSIHLLGASPTTPAGSPIASKLRFAAGKGLVFNGSGRAIVEGGDSSSATVERLYLIGAQADLTAIAGPVSVTLGTLITHPLKNDNRYFFECIKAGVNSGSADFYTLYVPDYSEVRIPNKRVELGYTVRDLNASTTIIWKCTTAGTTSATAGVAPPGGWDTTAGHTTTDGTAVFTAEEANDGRWLTDGTAVWACRQGAGVYAECRIIVRDCLIYEFTGPGVMICAGTINQSNANGFRISNVRVDRCGMGVAVRGTDANASIIEQVDVSSSGIQWPEINTGGLGIWDGSFLGNTIIGCQVANCNGPCYMYGFPDMRLFPQPGYSVFIGCYVEEGGPAPVGNSNGWVFGGNFSGVSCWPNGSIQGVINGGRGVLSLGGQTNSTHNNFTELFHPGLDASFVTGNDENGSFGFFHSMSYYDPPSLAHPGWWFETWGAAYAGIGMSGNSAPEGGGWGWDYYGRFKGGAPGDITGRFFKGYDPSTINDGRLRKKGKYEVGDRFDLQDDGVAGGWTGYIVKTAGYRGLHWTASTYSQASYPFAVVEPTVNEYPIPAAGRQVWIASVTGTTGTVEPSWPGSPTPGVTTIVDGTVTWTYLGTVPAYSRLGFIDDPVTGLTPQTKTQWADTPDTDAASAAAKTSVRASRTSITTTTTSANQVLASLAINNNTTCVVDVVVIGKGSGGANTATCKLSGSFMRNGGTITRLGTDDVGTVKANGTGSGTTFDLNINGGNIEVRTTPAFSTCQWAVVAQLAEEKD